MQSLVEFYTKPDREPVQGLQYRCDVVTCPGPILAGEFCIYCNLFRVDLETPASRALQ